MQPRHSPNAITDACLDLEGSLQSLLLLLDSLLGLEAHDTTTPLLPRLLGLLEVVLLDGRDELGKLVLVLGPDLSDGENSGGLREKNKLARGREKLVEEPQYHCSPSCGQRFRAWPCP